MSIKKPRIIILSSSLFTDRILLYSSFSKFILKNADVEVWASSFPLNEEIWKEKGYTIKPFPEVYNFRERLNILREINHAAWATALPAPAILGMRKFKFEGFKFSEMTKDGFFITLMTFWIGRVLGFFKLNNWFEKFLMPKLVTSSRSVEAAERLRQFQPDLLFATGALWMFDAAVSIEAVKLNIPVFSFIPSWDNITTKSRFTFESLAYGVWSNARVKELNEYYPVSKGKLVYEVGAPQYDVFYNTDIIEKKADFFESQRLNVNLPVVLWALGSPLFIKSEFQSGFYILEQMKKTGDLEKVQILVRLHPNKNHWKMGDVLNDFHPNVIVQNIAQEGESVVKRSQNESEIRNWVNSVYHCDLILNMTSTMLLDGTFFNKPGINIAYDDTPEAKFDAFLKSINATWPHVNSVVRSGASIYCASRDEVIAAIFAVLSNPNEHLEAMIKLRKDIVNNEDGLSGERLAMAVLDSINKQGNQS